MTNTGIIPTQHYKHVCVAFQRNSLCDNVQSDIISLCELSRRRVNVVLHSMASK